MKNALFLIMLFMSSHIFSQSITFDVDNMLAGPAVGNWMFDSDDPGFWTGDGNPFTYNDQTQWWHNRAYVIYDWSDENPETSSSCLAEDLAVLDGIENVTLKLRFFHLVNHEHFNTVNPNLDWNIPGQAGDTRDYAGGTGEIYVNGELKLRAVNCVLTSESPYSTAEEMRQILAPWGGQNWQNDVGTGEEITGSGWGTIDEENSDPDWVNEFDPLGFKQLNFEFGTFSHVVQYQYGYYDFEVTVFPALHEEFVFFDDLPPGRDNTLDFSEVDIVIDFDDGAVSGGQAPADTLRTVMVNQILTNPGGVLPPMINYINSMYWKIGTTLSSYNADITFDLDEIYGHSNLNDLRILKREHTDADWFIWNDFTLVDSSHIRANNVSDFSDWAIGSIGEYTLPCIDDLTISINENSVELDWTYPLEVDHFVVYKSSDPHDFEDADSEICFDSNFSEPVSENILFYRVTAFKE